MTVMHWFRVDLRTADNTALLAASLEAGKNTPVVALFIISPGEWLAHDWAACKVRFVLRGVRELSARLAKLNIPLLIRTAATPADVPAVVAAAAKETGATSVHANREYEINETRRDERTAALLKSQGVRFTLHHDQTAFPVHEVRTGLGGSYTVYTPFKKRWMEIYLDRGGAPAQGLPRQQAPVPIQSDDVPATLKGFDTGVSDDLWPAGEVTAMRRLNTFVAQRINRYKTDRDLPGIEGTSALSPYLASGMISSRQCLDAAIAANSGKLITSNDGATHWISEIIWREFYKQVLINFPRICMNRAFKPETERIQWSDREDHFEAWKHGRTGVPIVDAAMRALTQTGWMHNRLRMITAMYLTKDLFIDWRKGEKWFMQNLIDGDLSQNNGGWQWSASTGTDAAPYFRIFNAITQSQKFDEHGHFIRQWLPELQDVQGPALHDPSELPMLLKLKLNYPEPLVDRATVKDRVLAAFKRSE